MLKRDVFADIGDFVVAITDDQSIIPYPADTEMPSLILYHPGGSSHPEKAIRYSGKMTSMKDMVDWLVLNSLEPVSIFSEVIAYRLFAGPVK